MMYNMKNIISYDDEIILPKCMYRMKNPNELLMVDEINIQEQVMKFLKSPNQNMTELELRQDQLLKKLDSLYERIKTISSQCTHVSPSPPRESQNKEVHSAISTPEEIVLALSPDCLPYYVSFLLKVGNIPVNISWHIHSTVPIEKVAKIQAFVKKLAPKKSTFRVNLRLIFKCADAELKLSPVAVPIVGNVNILRYLAIVYPNTIFYDQDDYQMDSLLDLCHLLERTPEKIKDSLVAKLFAQHKDWIHKNKFSIVDVAAYNVIKQNKGKSVPKTWFEKCENMFL